MRAAALHARTLLTGLPRITHWVRQEVRAVLPEELSLPQYRVLHAMAQGPATVSELAEWIGVTAPAMSRSVDLLVKRGWVSRTPNVRDRRELRLAMTRKGAALFSKVESALEARLDTRIRTFSEQELKGFLGGLKGLEALHATLTAAV
jgi:DNA-binding MarR family transcriptional regulator